MGWSRNLNYVGEMMLYSSFAVLVRRWEVWFIYAYVWAGVFTWRMASKQYSLSQKKGWKEYSKRSWAFLPKLYNSSLLSIVVYSTFTLLCYCMWNAGGIEAFAKSFIFSDSF